MHTTNATERTAPSSRGDGISMSVAEVRAKALLDAIRACPEIATLDDVHHRVTGWSDEALGAAIDELVARGALVESCDGRLIALAWRTDQ